MNVENKLLRNDENNYFFVKPKVDVFRDASQLKYPTCMMKINTRFGGKLKQSYFSTIQYHLKKSILMGIVTAEIISLHAEESHGTVLLSVLGVYFAFLCED